MFKKLLFNSQLDARIQQERLGTLIHNLPTSLFSTFSVSLFLSYIVYDKVQTQAVLFWMGAVIALTFLRSVHLYTLKRKAFSSNLSDEMTILLGIFLSGSLLGSSLFFIFPANDFSTQALTFFLLSAMIAGAVAVFSTHVTAFIVYSFPIIIAFLLRTMDLPDRTSTLFVMGLVYYAIMLIATVRVNKSIIKSLQIQFLNQDLARNLSLAKEELEASNDELQMENSVREETEKRLYRLANYDPLTGLSNRHMFKEDLKQSLKSAKQEQTKTALLFLDLDNFKVINDTLGHAMGDKLLIAAASRLKSLLNSKSSIARLGGDEFVIIINDVQDDGEIALLCEKIIQLLETAFTFNEHEMFIGTSIGVSLYPDDAQEMDALLSYADTAMYTAKEKGKNNYQFFTSKMHESILFRHDIETKLHHAIENNEFRILYQPKIDVKNKKILGAEALLRWNQEELGEISPAVFIPIAEESSLINEIGQWVITAVCKDIAHLKNYFNNELCISINVSSSQILHQNLPQIIQDNLKINGIGSRSIELEFTENMLIKEARKSLQVLEELRSMGVKLSIDDFGTGYSSLNYLKILPIHALKIDKSFISDTPGCEGDCAIAKSIISLARNLNLDVIAEGVETPEQLRFLQENGCSAIQGFYFSRPLDINAFSAYVNAPASKIDQALLSDYSFHI